MKSVIKVLGWLHCLLAPFHLYYRHNRFCYVGRALLKRDFNANIISKPASPRLFRWVNLVGAVHT
jgi:hypothetical protein